MYKDFAAALMNGDKVVLCELYPAFEKPIDGVSARLVQEEMMRLGHEDVVYAESTDATLAYLLENIDDEDMLLIMGAGDIRSVSQRYADMRRNGINE